MRRTRTGAPAGFGHVAVRSPDGDGRRQPDIDRVLRRRPGRVRRPTVEHQRRLADVGRPGLQPRDRLRRNGVAPIGGARDCRSHEARRRRSAARRRAPEPEYDRDRGLRFQPETSDLAHTPRFPRSGRREQPVGRVVNHGRRPLQRGLVRGGRRRCLSRNARLLQRRNQHPRKSADLGRQPRLWGHADRSRIRQLPGFRRRDVSGLVRAEAGRVRHAQPDGR